MLGNSAVVSKMTLRFDFPLVNEKIREHQSHTERNYFSQTTTAGGLTAGTVRSSPARLTLAGVGGHAVAMNAAFCTVSWKQGSRSKLVLSKKPLKIVMNKNLKTFHFIFPLQSWRVWE